ncbi:MAG TPA: glycosyltransferase family 39 protein [bacterium]|nr:glycosyltransferase family 39 protein [bacterium]
MGRLQSPVQVQQEEAINLEFGRIFTRGDNLYPDIRQGGPYLHPSYPPLYPFLLSLWMKFLPGPWLPGRLPAFFGYLACGILLAAWGWRRWGWAPSLVMAGFLWVLPTWLAWGSMARMDCLLCAVNFLAFWVIWRMEAGTSPRNSNRHWLMGGLLNGLALLLKPTAGSLTLAMSGYALGRRQGKALALFLASSLAPLLLVTVYFQWKTGGMYLTQTIRWAATGFHADLLWGYVKGSLLSEYGSILAGLFLVLAMGEIPPLLKWQMAFATLGLLTLAREGAAENYYMEFTLYGLLVLGEGFFRAGTGLAEKFPRTAALYLAFTAASFFLPASPRVPDAAEVSQKLESARLYTAGDYLALDPDLPYLAGQKIWYQYSGLIPLYTNWLWNPEPLVRDIRDKKFKSVELYDIPHQYLLPAKTEEAIWQNYHVTLRKYGRVWLEPNG